MQIPKFKKIMNRVEDMMAATSFAEEGAFEAAQSLLKGQGRVLLTLKEGHIESKTLKYAVHAAMRINAALDILYVTSTETKKEIEPPVLEFLSELISAGVQHRVIRKTGCLKQEIIEYTEKEKDIVFAVVDSPLSLDAGCTKKDARLSELWRRLKCPLVVVTDGARA